ncbi:MAG: hypothetical protein SFY80_10245 [Verrucomicrobiota bacterium]|nr:hypothetical protein [Verrucomicrobiota bacterium]
MPRRPTALTIAFCYLLLATGCSLVPTSKGGDSTTTLSNGVAGTLNQPENPGAASSQNFSRKESTRTFYPAPWSTAPFTFPATVGVPASAGSTRTPTTSTTFPPKTDAGRSGEISAQPVGITNGQPATPYIVEHTVEESAGTEIGAAQDLSKILKAAKSKFRELVSVLLGIGLLYGAYRAFAEWRVAAICMGVGGLLSIICLDFRIGLGGVAAAALLYIAWHFKPIP